MLRELRVGVIGAGVMGEAIIAGLLRRELVRPEQVLAAAPRDERGRELHERYGIRVTNDNAAAARWGRILLLGIKPQMVAGVLPALRGALDADALLISVVAGATITQLRSLLDHDLIVRSMPNTPSRIGEGMTVWTASPRVSEDQRAWAATILGSLGHEMYLSDEHYLDMATALSGTGPAYTFLVMEAMIDAGVHLGFPRRIAEELVQQTMLGSVRYAIQSGQHPAELRNGVTSPGGTSAAAISELERGGLRTVLADAIWAAYRRSRELGGDKHERQH
jgi:pyrroline-5-carboxylate reductase